MRRGQKQQDGRRVERERHHQDEITHGSVVGRAPERPQVFHRPRSASTALRSPSTFATSILRSLIPASASARGSSSLALAGPWSPTVVGLVRPLVATVLVWSRWAMRALMSSRSAALAFSADRRRWSGMTYLQIVIPIYIIGGA